MYCSMMTVSLEKAGLILAEDDVDISFFAVPEQPSELRAAAVSTAGTVVSVYVVYLPFTLTAVIPEH